MPDSYMRTGGKPGVTDVIQALVSRRHAGQPSRPVEPDPDGKPVRLAPGESIINAKDTLAHIEPLVAEAAKTGTVSEESLVRHALPVIKRLVKPEGMCKGGKGFEDGGLMNWLGQKTHGLIGPSPGVQDTRRRMAGEQIPEPAKPIAQKPITAPAPEPKGEAPVGGAIGLTMQRIGGRRQQIEDAEQKALGYEEGGTIPSATTPAYIKGGVLEDDEEDSNSVLGKVSPPPVVQSTPARVVSASTTAANVGATPAAIEELTPENTAVSDYPVGKSSFGNASVAAFKTGPASYGDAASRTNPSAFTPTPVQPERLVPETKGFNTPIGGYDTSDVVRKVQSRIWQKANEGAPLSADEQDVMDNAKTKAGFSMADTLKINQGIRGYEGGGKLPGYEVAEHPIEHIDIKAPMEVAEHPIEHTDIKAPSKELPKIGVQEIPVSEHINVKAPSKFPALVRFGGKALRVLGGPVVAGAGLALHSADAGAGSDKPQQTTGTTEAGFKFDKGYEEGGVLPKIDEALEAAKASGAERVAAAKEALAATAPGSVAEAVPTAEAMAAKATVPGFEAAAKAAAPVAEETASKFPNLARLGRAVGSTARGIGGAVGGAVKGVGKLTDVAMGPVGVGAMLALRSPDVGAGSDIPPQRTGTTEAGFKFEPEPVGSALKKAALPAAEATKPQGQAAAPKPTLAPTQAALKPAAETAKPEAGVQQAATEGAAAEAIKNAKGRTVGVAFGPDKQSYIRTAAPSAGVERVLQGFQAGRYKMKETQEDRDKAEAARQNLNRIYGNLDRQRAEDAFQAYQANLADQIAQTQYRMRSGPFTNKIEAANLNNLRQLQAESQKEHDASALAREQSAAQRGVEAGRQQIEGLKFGEEVRKNLADQEIKLQELGLKDKVHVNRQTGGLYNRNGLPVFSTPEEVSAEVTKRAEAEIGKQPSFLGVKTGSDEYEAKKKPIVDRIRQELVDKEQIAGEGGLGTGGGQNFVVGKRYPDRSGKTGTYLGGDPTQRSSWKVD